MKNVKLNQPLQELILNYQVKLIDEIDFWSQDIEIPTKYHRGMIEGFERAKKLFIDTIKELEEKYNENI